MEEEKKFSDTPEKVKGMIIALKKLGLGPSAIARHINKWDYTISQSTVWRIIDQIDNGLETENRRSLCGRKPSIGNKTTKKMVDYIIEKRDRTAADIFRNKDLNYKNVSVRTI